MKLPTLERYNHVVLSVLGTGALLMVLLGLSIAMVELTSNLFSDTGSLPVTRVNDSDNDPASQAEIDYNFCQPIAVLDTPYKLIRVSSDTLAVRNVVIAERKAKKGFSSYDEYDSPGFEQCGYSGKGKTAAVVNVLVFNSENGTMQLALRENAVIYELSYPQENGVSDEDEHFPPPGMLYWEISEGDSNGDGVIDDEDDTGAYLSDADGGNRKRITPPLSRVIDRSYDAQRKLLLLRLVRDTNGNMRLDDDDQSSLVEVNVATRTMVRELLNKGKLAELLRAAEPKIAVTKQPGL